METLMHQKVFGINFSKTKTTFCLSLHENSDDSYLFLNGISKRKRNL